MRSWLCGSAEKQAAGSRPTCSSWTSTFLLSTNHVNWSTSYFFVVEHSSWWTKLGSRSRFKRNTAAIGPRAASFAFWFVRDSCSCRVFSLVFHLAVRTVCEISRCSSVVRMVNVIHSRHDQNSWSSRMFTFDVMSAYTHAWEDEFVFSRTATGGDRGTW